MGRKSYHRHSFLSLSIWWMAPTPLPIQLISPLADIENTLSVCLCPSLWLNFPLSDSLNLPFYHLLHLPPFFHPLSLPRYSSPSLITHQASVHSLSFTLPKGDGKMKSSHTWPSSISKQWFKSQQNTERPEKPRKLNKTHIYKSAKQKIIIDRHHQLYEWSSIWEFDTRGREVERTPKMQLEMQKHPQKMTKIMYVTVVSQNAKP